MMERSKRGRDRDRGRGRDKQMFLRGFWNEHYTVSAEQYLSSRDVFGFFSTICPDIGWDYPTFSANCGRIGFKTTKIGKVVKGYGVLCRSDASIKYHAGISTTNEAQHLTKGINSTSFSDSLKDPCKNKKGKAGSISAKRPPVQWGKGGCKLMTMGSQGQLQQRTIKAFPSFSPDMPNEVNCRLDHCHLGLRATGSELANLKRRIEESEGVELRHQLQHKKLKVDVQSLKEKNFMLLKEVSVLFEEERERLELLDQQATLDHLISKGESLQSEITMWKEQQLLENSLTSRSESSKVCDINNSSERLLAGGSETGLRGSNNQIGDERISDHGSQEKSGLLRNELLTQSSWIKEEVDFTSESTYHAMQNSICRGSDQYPPNDNPIETNRSTAGNRFLLCPPKVPVPKLLPKLMCGSNARGKYIAIYHHCGNPRYERIVNRRIEFGPLSTVSAPYAVVPCRAKAWYEVQYTRRGFGSSVGRQRVGWCFSKHPQSREHVETAIGDTCDSYGFDPFHGYKYHNGEAWPGTCFENGAVGYVGVALDMLTGKVWFSINGVWNEPLELGFEGSHASANLFPALSGCSVTMEVNFGDEAFSYEPPDPSFLGLKLL